MANPEEEEEVVVLMAAAMEEETEELVKGDEMMLILFKVMMVTEWRSTRLIVSRQNNEITSHRWRGIDCYKRELITNVIDKLRKPL